MEVILRDTQAAFFLPRYVKKDLNNYGPLFSPFPPLPLLSAADGLHSYNFILPVFGQHENSFPFFFSSFAVRQSTERFSFFSPSSLSLFLPAARNSGAI